MKIHIPKLKLSLMVNRLPRCKVPSHDAWGQVGCSECKGEDMFKALTKAYKLGYQARYDEEQRHQFGCSFLAGGTCNCEGVEKVE